MPFILGQGLPCPKCSKKMTRMGHPPDWKPNPRARHWYRWWDVCKRCPHTQHYREAIVYNRGIVIAAHLVVPEARSIDLDSPEGRAIVERFKK